MEYGILICEQWKCKKQTLKHSVLRIEKEMGGIILGYVQSKWHAHVRCLSDHCTITTPEIQKPLFLKAYQANQFTTLCSKVISY